MTARRDRNLRSGDLNEDLALLMLRELAAIADFRRQDDFGIDAVCTLFQEQGRELRPEDSFGVQIKSSSVRELKLTPEHIGLLRAVDIPMFHVLIDRSTTTLEMYSYEWIHPHELDGQATLTVDASNAQKEALGRSSAGLVSPSMIWLGPPVLTLSMADLGDAEYRRGRYELLKAWCGATANVIKARRHRVYPLLTWTTNSPPAFGVQLACTERTQQELVAVLADMMPYLAKLSFLLAHTKHGLPGKGTDQALFDEVQAIGWYARKLGIEPSYPLLYRPADEPMTCLC